MYLASYTGTHAKETSWGTRLIMYMYCAIQPFYISMHSYWSTTSHFLLAHVLIQTTQVIILYYTYQYSKCTANFINNYLKKP